MSHYDRADDMSKLYMGHFFQLFISYKFRIVRVSDEIRIIIDIIYFEIGRY